MLWGDGSPTREFLYVEDCADGLVLRRRALRRRRARSTSAPGREISIRELAELVADVTGFEGEIRWDTSMPNGQPRRSLDASRAARALRLRGADAAARGARAHGRLVPRQSRPAASRRSPLRAGAAATRSAVASSASRGACSVPLLAVQWPPTIVLALDASRHNGWRLLPGRRPDLATHDGLAPRHSAHPADASSAISGRSSSRRSPSVAGPTTSGASGARRAAGARPRPDRAPLRLRHRGRGSPGGCSATGRRRSGSIAPFVAIPLFVERYHAQYVDQFLPQPLGLTAMADFPSMVLPARRRRARRPRARGATPGASARGRARDSGSPC